MSRTYRKNPPNQVHDIQFHLLRGGDIRESPAIPAITRDGNVCLSYRREKGWARRMTLNKWKAKCKQALYHEKEFPRDPHTCGWVTW